MADSNRWKSTVYVGGLSSQVTAAHLHDAFLPFGDVADVKLPKNDRPRPAAAQRDADGGGVSSFVSPYGGGGAGRGDRDDDGAEPGHRGFAYVEFEDADDAKEAIDNMDKSEFFGRIIKVTPAKPPKNAGEGLGSRTALWKQEGWLEQNAVSEEDRLAVEQGTGAGDAPADPMQGLEELDVAGPRLQ